MWPGAAAVTARHYHYHCRVCLHEPVVAIAMTSHRPIPAVKRHSKTFLGPARFTKSPARQRQAPVVTHRTERPNKLYRTHKTANPGPLRAGHSVVQAAESGGAINSQHANIRWRLHLAHHHASSSPRTAPTATLCSYCTACGIIKRTGLLRKS